MCEKWKVEYDNDTGPLDEYYVEWWVVTDKERSFTVHSKVDAQWLCSVLNGKEAPK